MSVLIKNGRRYGGAGTMTYTELSDKPSINNVTLSGNKTTSDLGLFSGDYDDLTDKPTLGTAAALDVAASGDAGNNEVVLGNDSRLSDARQASDVYSWAKAENKPSYTANEVGAIASTSKGVANGVAELDANGLVPSAQLPSYVDDVLEYSSSSLFPVTGETGKIYVDTTTNIAYRWSGTTYVAIGSDLALGETSSTAYRGDRGKDAYDHSQLTSGNPHNVTKSDVGLSNVGNFKAVSTVAEQGLTSTEQANARDNIGAPLGEGLSFSIRNGNLYVSMSTPPEPLVAFSTATDAQIAGILDAYYNGEYTLAEIQEVWHVGDTRTISLSAMEATGVSESHNAQTAQIVILDFDHDDLQTSINGHTKAAVSLQFVDCLNTKGYMNSTNTNVGGWTLSARRTWCNNVFYAALPNAWQSMVKTVQKKTSAGNESDTINTDNDKCWFPSEIEVFNTTSYSQIGEGSQYPYYTTTANHIKKISGSAGPWWLRSPYRLLSSSFVNCLSNGLADGFGSASYNTGLAPAFCL